MCVVMVGGLGPPQHLRTQRAGELGSTVIASSIDRGAGAQSAPRAVPSIRAAVRLQLEKKSLLSSQQRPARRPGPPAI